MSRQKVLRIILSLALLGVPLMAFVGAVEAAKLTEVKDVVSDSGTSAAADHEISFKSTSGIAAGNTITLTFDPSGQLYNLTGVDVSDIDMEKGTCGSEAAVVLAGSPAGTTWGVVVSDVTDTVTITSGTDTVTAGDCVVIYIGHNATGAGANAQIDNPSAAAVYDLDVATTSDDGLTKLAVLSHVSADVTVDETLTFTVTGQTTAQCTVVASDVNTTATSISYGSTNADTFKAACQELAVSTNATGGYSVTVQQDGLLTSAGSDTIASGTCDGGCSISSPAAWATASNNGFGYIVGNVTGTDAVDSTGYRILGTLGTDTPEPIMSNAGVVSGSTIEVNYKISIDGAQPAGTYQNDIIYVATPTY